MLVMEQIKKMSLKSWLQWILTFTLPLIIFLVPTPESFTHAMKLYSAITVLAIMTLIFELVNITIVGILLPVLYILFGVTTPKIAYSSYSSHIVWLVLGSFMIAQVLERVGLAKRIAYKCVLLGGASYRGILFGLMGASVILMLIVPSKVHFIMAPFCYSLVLALGLGKSKASAGIMLTGAASCSLAGMFLFGPNIVLMEEIGSAATGPISLPWVGYFTNNIPSIFYMVFIVFFFSIIFKPDKPLPGKQYFVEQAEKMGKLSRDEKKVTFVCVILFIALFTSSIHNIQIGWLFVTIAALLYLPGINVGTKEDLQKVNYGFVIFLAACYSIGNVAGDLGMGKLVADGMLPYLTGKSDTVVLSLIWLIGVIINVFLTPQAMIASLTLPMAEIATNLGINPHAVYFTMLSSYDQLFMPFESGVYLIFFSFGVFSLKHFIKGMYPKMVFDLVFLITILFPFWRLVGFL